MRILYLYCHPLPESFHGAIRAVALAGLARAGHDVDLCDLYAEGFNPVLGPTERRNYHNVADNRRGVETYVERLQQAEALVVQFPTWCFGPPAILKGFFDRLYIPGVAFELADGGQVRPLLTRLRKLAGLVTYGRPRMAAWWMGDPPRSLVTRYLPWFGAARATVAYHALYGLNTASDRDRRAFLVRVEHGMESF